MSLKKDYNKVRFRQSNYIPLSSSPYQLSVSFSHRFLSRYQYDIYHQSWCMVRQMLHGYVHDEGIFVKRNRFPAFILLS